MKSIHLYCYSYGKDENLAARMVQQFINPAADVCDRVKIRSEKLANVLPFIVVGQGAEIGATDCHRRNQPSGGWSDYRAESCHSLCLMCLLNRRAESSLQRANNLNLL
jgi:hypothetical protein